MSWVMTHMLPHLPGFHVLGDDSCSHVTHCLVSMPRVMSNDSCDSLCGFHFHVLGDVLGDNSQLPPLLSSCRPTAHPIL